MSVYTPEIADLICDEIADGKSLRAICREPDMPNVRTVQRWLEADEEFATKCARARLLQADAIFDEMQEVADTGNEEDVQRAKLRVSTMQWRASKLAPKKYGDKTLIGSDPENPLPQGFTVNLVKGQEPAPG